MKGGRIATGGSCASREGGGYIRWSHAKRGERRERDSGTGGKGSLLARGRQRGRKEGRREKKIPAASFGEGNNTINVVLATSGRIFLSTRRYIT